MLSELSFLKAYSRCR